MNIIVIIVTQLFLHIARIHSNIHTIFCLQRDSIVSIVNIELTIVAATNRRSSISKFDQIFVFKSSANHSICYTACFLFSLALSLSRVRHIEMCLFTFCVPMRSQSNFCIVHFGNGFRYCSDNQIKATETNELFVM